MAPDLNPAIVSLRRQPPPRYHAARACTLRNGSKGLSCASRDAAPLQSRAWVTWLKAFPVPLRHTLACVAAYMLPAVLQHSAPSSGLAKACPAPLSKNWQWLFLRSPLLVDRLRIQNGNLRVIWHVFDHFNVNIKSYFENVEVPLCLDPIGHLARLASPPESSVCPPGPDCVPGPPGEHSHEPTEHPDGPIRAQPHPPRSSWMPVQHI